MHDLIPLQMVLAHDRHQVGGERLDDGGRQPVARHEGQGEVRHLVVRELGQGALDEGLLQRGGDVHVVELGVRLRDGKGLREVDV